ncbi:MAG: hypothetical protein HYW45_02575 [Candidatus Daviesbacteria bacterium]|nr:MAG: hypothetical protein HYW45_02575 [Candidatus Daviesbacteria bacterium]
MNLIITNLYLFAMATVLALLEIQIEGAHGWAKNLPTWRPHPGHPLAKIYAKFMSGKELTGYHSAMFIFVVLIFHLPYVFGLTFTLEHWLQTLSLFFIFIALWDFLWFVFNPYHPLKNFSKNNPNHKAFFLGLPLDYYWAIAFSFSLAAVAQFIFGFSGFISWWLGNFGLFLTETVGAILFSYLVLDIDNWF